MSPLWTARPTTLGAPALPKAGTESTEVPRRRNAASTSNGPYTKVGRFGIARRAANARRGVLSANTTSRTTESVPNVKRVSEAALGNGVPSDCMRARLAVVMRPSRPSAKRYRVRATTAPLRCTISPSSAVAVRVHCSIATVSFPSV